MKGSGLAADEVEGRGGANAGGGENPTPGAGWRRCGGVDGVKTTGGTGNSFAMAAAIGKEAAAATARVRDLGSCGGSRSIRPERPTASLRGSEGQCCLYFSFPNPSSKGVKCVVLLRPPKKK